MLIMGILSRASTMSCGTVDFGRRMSARSLFSSAYWAALPRSDPSVYFWDRSYWRLSSR